MILKIPLLYKNSAILWYLSSTYRTYKVHMLHIMITSSIPQQLCLVRLLCPFPKHSYCPRFHYYSLTTLLLWWLTNFLAPRAEKKVKGRGRIGSEWAQEYRKSEAALPVILWGLFYYIRRDLILKNEQRLFTPLHGPKHALVIHSCITHTLQKPYAFFNHKRQPSSYSIPVHYLRRYYTYL